MILRFASEALGKDGRGYRVKTALNGKEALEALGSAPVDLVLTDLKMPVMDGYELLSHMSSRHRDIPVIVMTGYGSPEIARQLESKGIRHYIEKPFELQTLKGKIDDVFSAGSKGYIHGFTLANFLQAVEVEEKTITLRITSRGRIGYLHLHRGALVDADTEEFKGEPAALEILCWDDPQIEMQGLRSKKRTIHSGLIQILLEASRRKDEAGALPPSSEHQLRQAIFQAEAHRFKDAQKSLAVFLKENPRSPKGWLWYSRIIANVKSIEASLSNAAKLAPGDPVVMAEMEKLKRVQPDLGEGSIRRCPFCWAPAAAKAARCANCRGHMILHEGFFSAPLEADKEVMEKAIERYTRVIGREINIHAHYYLALAHLNLARWERGLNLFHKTVNLAPDRKALADQLRMLLNHMASVETDAAPAPETPPARAPAEEGARKRVLVVEDSPTTRKVITITLGQQGYEVIEARDGLEALSKLNEGQPHLILLDIVLPKMDGYKILEIIRKNALFKHIPVIMLTSKDSMISKWKGRLAGSTAYLTKPFDPRRLVATVRKHIA